MRAFLLTAVLALVGCTDDDKPPTCTNEIYDPCTANDQCSSNMCHLFSQASLQVCVATCTPGDNSTCPVDSTGVNGQCNNMGICKPATANECTR